MMEVQEALNYLVVEFQTNHDFRWGLFTVGGTLLNAIVLLLMGRSRSKPVAVEVDVLKSYEKSIAISDELITEIKERQEQLRHKPVTGGSGTQPKPPIDLAVGVPPAPAPVPPAPKPFSDLVEKLLALKDFTWGTEWSRHLQDGSKQNVDEYLAYQTGNVMVGFAQINSLSQDPAIMMTLCLVDSDTLIEKLPRDFTKEEWIALTDKFYRIREKVLAHEKQEVEKKAMEIMFKTAATPLSMYHTDRLKEEIKKREQKPIV